MVTWIPYSTMQKNITMKQLQQALANCPKPKKAAKKRNNKNGTRSISSMKNAPVAGTSTVTYKAPIFKHRSSSGERIEHCEFVETISGSIAFSVTKYPCNPGLSAVFPWLSQIAQRWDQYRFHKLAFHYLTRASTATVGSVIMAPDYDASDPDPSSEQQMTTYLGAAEDAVWKQFSVDLDVNAMFPTGPRKFTRSANVAGDIKLYDAANFFVATLEEIGTDQIGKLWVSYDAEFWVPQTQAAVASQPEQTSYYAENISQTFATGVDELVVIPTQFDPIGFGSQNAGAWTPPAGIYRLEAQVSCQDTTSEAFSGIVAFFKNGAEVTGQRVQFRVGPSGSGVEQQICTIIAVLGFSGTDTFAINANLIGAAGTLTVIANTARLLVSCA